MTFWILPISCIPIPRFTVILIQPHELNDIHVTKLLKEYTNTVNLKIGDHTKFIVPDNLQNTSLTSSEPFFDNWEGDITMLPFEPSSEENAMEQLDEFIGTQIPLETKTSPALIKVISRKRSSDGTLIGQKNPEPQLDSRLYNVKFPDRHFEQYSANVLHESLTSKLDDQGYDIGHIKELCGYRFSPKMIPRNKSLSPHSMVTKHPLSLQRVVKFKSAGMMTKQHGFL